MVDVGFRFGVMHPFGNHIVEMVAQSVNILKAAEECTVKWCALWYVNFISVCFVL